MTTTRAPAQPCKCGCGRPLETPRMRSLGYAEPCIKRWKRLGCPEGGPLPPWGAHKSVRETRMDRLEDLFAEGFSYAQAAPELGITVRSVENYARKLNVRKRARGEALMGTLRPAVPLPAARRWQDRGACRGHADLFFGPDGERLADRQARETAARSLCEWCPVRVECLAEGRGHKYGVWAGMSEEDRERQQREEATAA